MPTKAELSVMGFLRGNGGATRTVIRRSTGRAGEAILRDLLNKGWIRERSENSFCLTPIGEEAYKNRGPIVMYKRSGSFRISNELG